MVSPSAQKMHAEIHAYTHISPHKRAFLLGMFLSLCTPVACSDFRRTASCVCGNGFGQSCKATRRANIRVMLLYNTWTYATNSDVIVPVIMAVNKSQCWHCSTGILFGIYVYVYGQTYICIYTHADTYVYTCMYFYVSCVEIYTCVKVRICVLVWLLRSSSILLVVGYSKHR